MKIIIASGPVIIEKNKVLLNISGKDAYWKFCGGKIGENESLIETAKRRVKEELGIEIETENPEPFLLHITQEKEGVMTDVILVHYLAKRIGEISPGEDIREWKWIPFSELEKEDLAPNIIPTLKHFNLL